jgi:hypothetical protein
MRIAVIGVPRPYDEMVPDLPSGLAWVGPRASRIDLVHLFVRQERGLAGSLTRLRGRIAQDGMIWVSWPKKASKMETDLTEDVVRRTALAADLVDVKVCAVDEVWSGLKLVIRRKDRR